MISVNTAKYIDNYELQLTFNNGKEAMVNLEDMVVNDRRKIFIELKDIARFKDFKVEHSTVVWSNDLDLAPEYLFYLAFKEDKSFQCRFKQWGYI